MNWEMNTFKYLYKCLKHREEILELFTSIRTDTPWFYNPTSQNLQLKIRQVNDNGVQNMA